MSAEHPRRHALNSKEDHTLNILPDTFLAGDGHWRNLWPLGSVYFSTTSTNPRSTIGFGTWTQVAKGQFIVGQTGDDTDFDVALETGGAKTHTHDAHTTANAGGTGATVLTGPVTHSSPSHLPPYVVLYVWRRTA